MPPKSKSKVTATPTPTLGGTADRMWELREAKRELEAKVELIDQKYKALETVMFGLLDAQSTRRAEGSKSAVSIRESIVCNVTDWDALWPWIAKNKFFHFVQKRVSDPAAREIWGLGKVIPGAEPYKKRILSLTSLKSTSNL